MPDLRPHQRTAVEWLKAHPRRYLADQMRVGKTPATLVAAEELGIRNLLVVCPAIVRDNWRAEALSWRFSGRVLVLSYNELLQESKCLVAEDFGADLVVLDEAHFVKNWRAKRSKAALRLAKRAPRAWLLSGTPMPNDPSELWAPLASLWPEILRERGITRERQWLYQTCVVADTVLGPKIVAVRKEFDLRGLLEPIMLRRTFEEISAGMPPLWWREHTLTMGAVQLTPEQEAALERELHGVTSLESASSRRQLAIAKAPAAAELLVGELTTGGLRQAILLGWHVDALSLVKDRLVSAGLPAGLITGSTPNEARQQTLAAFREGKLRVVVGQIEAMGTGVNLSTADEVMFLELAWTPGWNWQAAMRASVVGKGTVPVRVLHSSHPLDRAVQRRLMTKTEMIAHAGLE